MEYNLQLEKQRKSSFLIFIVASLVLFMLVSFKIIGILGVLLFSLFLLLMVFTPAFLDKYKFLLFSLAFASIFFDRYNILIAIFIPIGLTLIFAKSGDTIKRFPVVLSLVIFLIYILINIFRADEQILNVYRVFRFHFLEIFAILLTFLYIQKCPSLKLFNILNIFVSFNSLIAIGQRLTGIGLIYSEGVSRAMGFLGHPNIFSLLLNIFIPLSIYMALFLKDSGARRIWRITLALNVIALFLTFSKTAFIVFLIEIGIMLLFVPLKLKARIFISLFLFFALFLTIDNIFNLRIIDSILYRLNNSDSIDWRLRYWKLVISAITPSTVFWGNGVNKCSEFMMAVNPNAVANIHNVYLQNFFDYGLWSIFYYIPFLFMLKKFVVGFFHKNIYCIFPIMTISGFLVDMITSPGVGIRSPFLIAWIILVAFYYKLNSKYIDEEKYLERISVFNIDNKHNVK